MYRRRDGGGAPFRRASGTRSRVLRDGAWHEMPLRRRRALATSFRLSAGDLVPADGASARVARPLRSAIDADGRVAARPTRRPGAADGDRDGPRCAESACSSARRSSAAPATAIVDGHRAQDGVRRHRRRACGSRAPETEFERGLRRFSLLILRTTVVAGAVHPADGHRRSTHDAFEIAAVRGRAGRRADAGVPADDRARSRSRRARCAWRATRSS